MSITAIPFMGEHADLNIASKAAYLVRVNGHSLLFAADSCNISPSVYEHVHREIGDVEVLFLGMECDGAPLSWIYGPLLTQKLERAQGSFPQARRLGLRAGESAWWSNSDARRFMFTPWARNPG